ncbi:IS3 family transposase [Pusillimonas caeni]|nr:IS3 family transposase [Pusillimonas caeni]
MVRDRGYSVSEVCESVGVGETALRRWLVQYDAEQLGQRGPGRPISPEQQRIRQLEAELHQAKLDNEPLKKSLGLLCPRAQVSFALVAHLQQKAYSVSHICRVLGVSRSGYYAQRKRRVPAKALREQIHAAAAFRASGSTYGSRRLCRALRDQGLVIGRHRTRTLMRQAHLRPVWKRRFVLTTVPDHGKPVFQNVLNRQFDVAQPNCVWATDITYVRTGQGGLYLAAVLDLCSRRVVGWATAPTTHTWLVRQALERALNQRRPGPGLLLHSDRGFQYVSAEYQALLARHDIQCSMSRKGDCWDNAVMERFFLSLKVERLNRHRYATQAQARCDIQDYIENFYNTQRLHSALGYLTPAHYEAGLKANTPKTVSTKT